VTKKCGNTYTFKDQGLNEVVWSKCGKWSAWTCGTIHKAFCCV